MMRVGHPDLRIGADARLTHHEERKYARHVRLPRQELQVEHQLYLLFERRRNAYRPVDNWQLAGDLFLGFLDATLDVAYGVEVLGQLRLIAGSEFRFERG